MAITGSFGKYVFNEDKVKTEDGLRDLYLKK